MEAIDFWVISEPLILEQFKKQYGPDDTTGSGGPSAGQSQVAVVTFPRYSFLSNVVPFSITNSAALNVEWSDGQENKGQLFYGQDFTVSGNKIQLTNGAGGTTDWTPTVQANALGLLNITISQEN